MAIPIQAVFVRDMLFNFVSVIDRRVATDANQLQVDIDNIREHARRFKNDYTIGERVYAEMKGIYRKLDYGKQGPYRTT